MSEIYFRAVGEGLKAVFLQIAPVIREPRGSALLRPRDQSVGPEFKRRGVAGDGAKAMIRPSASRMRPAFQQQQLAGSCVKISS